MRTLCFVAEAEGRIVGAIRHWPVRLGATGRALLLGPIAVDPVRERQGIGRRLMRAGLYQAAAVGHEVVVAVGTPSFLVGSPAFLCRFGFANAKGFGITLPGLDDPRSCSRVSLPPAPSLARAARSPASAPRRARARRKPAHEVVEPLQPLPAQPLGAEDRAHVLHGLLQRRVDHHVVVLAVVTHLVRRAAHPLRHHGRAVLGAAVEPLLERLKRRRQDEDADQVAPHRLGKLLAALPVDVEDDVAPGVPRAFHRVAGGAVPVAEHLRALEELPALAQAGEGGLLDEVVVPPSISSGRFGRVVWEIEISTPPPSSSTRRRVIVVLPAPEGDDSTSRRPRRCTAGAVSGALTRYSTFCTCSRNWSMAALRARPMS